MKKTLLLIIFSSFTLACLNAQENLFSLGVQTGVNLSNLDNEGAEMDARVGYQFGVVGEYKLPNDFFLQGNLNVSSKGARMEVEGDMDIDGDGLYERGLIKSKWNAVYLELPVLAGYKVRVTDNFGIKFMAGPYFAYGIGGNISATYYVEIPELDGSYLKEMVGKDKINTFSEETLRRFDFGLSGAVAAQYSKFTLTIGYDYGVTNISQGSNGIHNRNAFVTVGYTFF